jgi:hypothetical protein
VNVLAELLDLLDLAGDLGGESLLERLQGRVSTAGGMQRHVSGMVEAYSALGRVGAGGIERSLSHGGGSGHGGAQGRRTDSHGCHYDGC